MGKGQEEKGLVYMGNGGGGALKRETWYTNPLSLSTLQTGMCRGSATVWGMCLPTPIRHAILIALYSSSDTCLWGSDVGNRRVLAQPPSWTHVQALGVPHQELFPDVQSCSLSWHHSWRTSRCTTVNHRAAHLHASYSIVVYNYHNSV